ATAIEGVEGEVALQATAVAAGAGLAIGNSWDMADFAGIAPAAAHHRAVMNHGTAKADAEIEVVVVRELCTQAVELFAKGGTGHVRVDEGGQAGRLAKPLLERHILPAGHGRRADEAHGFDAERTGQRHAGAQDPFRLADATQFGNEFADQLEGEIGGDVRGGAMSALDDIAAEIDKCRIDAKRRQVDAGDITALGIDPEHRRGNAAALRLLADGEDVALFFEFADDGGNGLHRQADALGDLGACDRAVQPDRLENDTPVVRTA
ncbi:conserved hypothetical protein, partial [Ricinus communis]